MTKRQGKGMVSPGVQLCRSSWRKCIAWTSAEDRGGASSWAVFLVTDGEFAALSFTFQSR